MVPFLFAGQEMLLGASRALYWPAERALLIADLHLEKASFFARHGQMLPPYDSRETLGRVAQLIRETGARRVFCLGDNFHDDAGVDRLEPHAAGMLEALTRASDWVWITGNHDANLSGICGGTPVDELVVSGLILRHRAIPGERGAEMSGHFHPRLRLTVKGRSIVRPCAILAMGHPEQTSDQHTSDKQASGSSQTDKLILPAFGALTGGMDAADPVIRDAVQPAGAIDALVAASGRIARFPLWRAAA